MPAGEHLVRLDLDVKCRVIGVETVHVGTLDSVQISPRELFRGALLSGAASIIVLHSHPSGSSEPSAEDEQVAEQLADAGRLLHVQVLDFLVIGDGGRVIRPPSFCHNILTRRAIPGAAIQSRGTNCSWTLASIRLPEVDHPGLLSTS